MNFRFKKNIVTNGKSEPSGPNLTIKQSGHIGNGGEGETKAKADTGGGGKEWTERTEIGS